MLQQKGSALILMLLITSLMGICVFTSFRYIQNSLSAVKGELLTYSTRETAVRNAFAQKIDLRQLSSRRTICHEAIALKGDLEISRLFCAHYYPCNFTFLSQGILDASSYGIDKMPAFDYAALFQHPARCDSVEFPWNGHSPSGFRLSPGAVVSSQTCSIAAMNETVGLAINSNLFLNRPLTILRPQDAKDFATLAAKGFIDADTIIQLSSDALLVAGGDLHIKSLAAAPGAKLKATAISATGAVLIEEIGDGISLKAAAKEGVRLPHNYSSSSKHFLLPPLIQVLPFALQAGHSSSS